MTALDIVGNIFIIHELIIYMKKFLHADWLRACQLIPNSAKTCIFLVQKDEISAES